MTEFFEFAVLGLGLAAAYSLLGSGLVLIYRGSGVVNFAHGTFAMGGAIIFVELRDLNVPVGLALAASAAAGVVAGVLIQNSIMLRLRNAAPIARIIATLGIFVTLLAAASIHFSDNLIPAAQFLPQHTWTVGGVAIPSDRVLLFGISCVITLVLAVASRKLLIGVATSAAAENEQAASILGWSPNSLATLNWGIATGLASLAGAFIVPLSGLLVGNLALLIVPALAAALLGRMNSFSLTLAGATAIGVLQSLITRYWSQPGAADGVPFVMIILILVLTGRALPLREYVYDRLPRIGDGTVRPAIVAIVAAASIVAMSTIFDQTWQLAFAVSLASAIVLLSMVVLLGYAGQISLAQGALAGIGAYVAGRLVAVWGVPFWLAFIVAIVAAVPIGVVFAFSALRTRGVSLAVVTLGLGVAVYSMLFSNPNYTGGITGTVVGDTRLFGLDISSLYYPDRYGVFVLVLFILAALAVANLRRSSSGRRMIAIRENERAAASLGISVIAVKTQAFSIAAILATVGGVAMAFGSPSILYENFDPLLSISSAAFVVIGGLGFVVGPLLGATLAPGGVGSLFDGLLQGISGYLTLIGGIAVILVLLQNPNGMVEGMQHQGRWIARQVRRLTSARLRARILERRPRSSRGLWGMLIGQPRPVTIAASAPARPRNPHPLVISDLSVRFGGTVALDHAGLRVEPGQVMGLIGPNGAGKTTLIDAVTGFVRSSGQIRLGDLDVAKQSPHQRAAAGVVRSWQSLELFEDISVLENLQVAAEQRERRWWNILTAVLRPDRPRLSGSAAAVVEVFGLRDDLDRKPGDLSYGQRRLVGIARAVALNPRILLLDEPAAGLSTIESKELGRLIRQLSREWGMGVLLVEHDVDLVMSICDRVSVLNFGKVIAEAAPAEVRANPDVIAAYLGEPEDVKVES